MPKRVKFILVKVMYFHHCEKKLECLYIAYYSLKDRRADGIFNKALVKAALIQMPYNLKKRGKKR